MSLGSKSKEIMKILFSFLLLLKKLYVIIFLEVKLIYISVTNAEHSL